MASVRVVLPGFCLLSALHPLEAAAGRRSAQEAPASACPAPPINPTLTEQSAASGEVSAQTMGFGGSVSADLEQGRTYAGTGLSQDAADQAYKVYQLCLQAEKGLIPKEVYVEALRAFYGFQAPQPVQVSPVVGHSTPAEPSPQTRVAGQQQAPAGTQPLGSTGGAGDPASITVDALAVTEGGPEPEQGGVGAASGEGGDVAADADSEPEAGAALSATPAIPAAALAAASSPAAASGSGTSVAAPSVSTTVAAPVQERCDAVVRGDSVHAKLRGTIGVNEALAWAPNARVGWLWSTKAAGLTSQTVRIWPDGSLDVPGPFDLEAGFQTFSTLDTTGWISRAVEGTVWGDDLVDVNGWRVVGDGGVVVALRDGAAVDLSPFFDGGPPAAVYQLPVVDDSESKSLVLSMDPGVSQVDTLIRTWWVDTACL